MHNRRQKFDESVNDYVYDKLNLIKRVDNSIDDAQKIEIIIEKPRPFIVHSTFIGPRRTSKKLYTEPERRQTAPVVANAADVRKKKNI